MGLASHIRIPPRVNLGALADKANEQGKIPEEIKVLLSKGAIMEATIFLRKALYQIFPVEKRKTRNKSEILVKTKHFKMEGLHIFPGLIQADDWIIKLYLKDAYLRGPIHQECHHLLQLQWNSQIYQFQCLLFGLTSALRVFSKVMKPVVGTLRHMGICLMTS